MGMADYWEAERTGKEDGLADARAHKSRDHNRHSHLGIDNPDARSGYSHGYDEGYASA